MRFRKDRGARGHIANVCWLQEHMKEPEENQLVFHKL